MVKLLIKNSANINAINGELIKIAIELGNKKMIEILEDLSVI